METTKLITAGGFLAVGKTTLLYEASGILNIMVGEFIKRKNEAA